MSLGVVLDLVVHRPVDNQLVGAESGNTDRMTTDLNEIVIHTAVDLEHMWQLIMGREGPGLRSLWLVLLDEEGRPRPVAVPIDDIPVAPDSMARGLADVLSNLRDLGDPVLLLSRPGPNGMTEADRQWGRALAPLTRWPVHLYTGAGVRVLAPDDLMP
jgi:hypothetical protein